MSKKIKILAIVVIVLALGILAGQNIPEGSLGRRDGAGQRKSSVEDFRAESGNILPKQSTPQKTELSFTATAESTVYELMADLRTQDKVSFTEKNYIGMGKLIDSIGGIKSNGEKTWIYYVNGAKAAVGVSNYQIKPGDVVSWKYEKLLAY